VKNYAKLIKRAMGSVDYWTQLSIREFVRELTGRMDSEGLNRSDLAKKIGSSPSYITKILRGDANFTLESMNKLAMAVGGRVKVSITLQAKQSVVSQTSHVTWSQVAGPQLRRIEFKAVELPRRLEASNEWEHNPLVDRGMVKAA
jgi:antitoxin component HigA of HigAB toxin-antitoxin module